MKQDFLVYWDSLYRNMPYYILVPLGVVLFVGVFVILFRWGIKDGLCKVVLLVLVEYVFLLYFITVFSRAVSDIKNYNFTPFWSYFAYFSGDDPQLLPENIMNVFIFIPVGFLLATIFIGLKYWQCGLIGFIISLGIETIQFIYKRGFAEIDDVIHNTLGCIIGYGIYRFIYMCVICKTKQIYGK